MTATRNRQVVFSNHPVGEPSPDCFEVVDAPVPSICDGQALVRVLYLSIDPAQRIWMNPGGAYGISAPLGAPMLGLAVGEVVDSRNPDYSTGVLVEGMLGWQEYAVVDSEARKATVLPTGIDPAAALGVFGLNGQTAYWGLFDIGQPKEGETVLVSAAAGATGSLVGQMAKIARTRVVGMAGSADKRTWLTEDLGFDAAVDYRDLAVAKLLDEACPDGIDVYFDNVGGPLLDLALERLNVGGRIVLCGAIANYNDTAMAKGPHMYRMLIRQRGRMQGFIVFDYIPRYPESLAKLTEWESQGRLQHREDVLDGLERAPEALGILMRGENRGKLLVKV